MMSPQQLTPAPAGTTGTAAPIPSAAQLAARIQIPRRLPPRYDRHPLQHLSHSSYNRFVLCASFCAPSTSVSAWGAGRSGRQTSAARQCPVRTNWLCDARTKYEKYESAMKCALAAAMTPGVAPGGSPGLVAVAVGPCRQAQQSSWQSPGIAGAAQQPSPRQVSRPSRSASAAIPSATVGSAHHQPSAVLRARPVRTPAAR